MVFALALGAALLPGPGAEAENPTVTAVPGKPVFIYGSYDLATQGYRMAEYFVSGSAASYALAGGPAANGIIPAKVADHAAYETRLIVLTPADPAKFNGTVIVEWLNVSGGQDVPVDYIMLHRELLRAGYAYVGVSAQKVGIDGGPGPMGLGKGLKQADPARYGKLTHPGDAYSFDIFSDAARLLRAQPATLLGPLKPKWIIATGQSQSAMYLTTYVNEVDPLAHVYDGFLIHSRPGFAPSLGNTPIRQTPLPALQKATPLTADPRVPVLQLITETDLVGIGALIGFYPVQQADAPHLRTWEIAGAAHLDNYELGVGMIDTPQLPVSALAAAWAPKSEALGLGLPVPLNNGPQHHYVAEAALAWLNQWVASGTLPPRAAPIVLTTVTAKGGTAGGVRTPWVDVPVSRLSGFPVTVMGAGAIAGAVFPYGPPALAQFYPGGEAEYLRQFQAALDKTIKAGFLLPADRQEILDLARFGYPPSARPLGSQ
jgi:hypothetical protein